MFFIKLAAFIVSFVSSIAGDFVKFGLPMAQSATLLAWGLIEYEAAYRGMGELDNMRDSLKWATDYFIKAHSGPNEFYAQVVKA